MSITPSFEFQCDGCHTIVVARGERLKSRFRGFNGRDYGFGVWEDDKPDVVAATPEGWMAFDPLTRCCYCPDCVESIWPDPEDRHGILAGILKVS